MKKLIVLFLFAATSVLFLQNCKKDTQNQDQNSQITDDEAKAVVSSDKSTADIMDLVDLFAFNSTTSTRSSFNLPACVTQTIVHIGSTLTITWEFDANGCTMPNGNTYQGTVTITRNRDITTHTVTGSISFNQFYVNGVHIEGSSNFTRQLQNANGNPEITHNYDFTFTFPNGDVAIRQGTRTREWIQGFGTPAHNDDVFEVTGNSHIQFRNGVIIDAQITTPLRREITCQYFVSGVIEITKNNQTATLDFGSGTCDNEATLTLPNGQVRIIYL